jgi:ATP-dependent Clp protease adaptor protein ClpS
VGVLPWSVVVWNDPVNLVNYVAWVFERVLGYDRPAARALTLRVHEDGKAVVAWGSREKAESDVKRLHAYGIWATLERMR